MQMMWVPPLAMDEPDTHLQNMRLRNKLLIGFAIPALLMSALSAVQEQTSVTDMISRAVYEADEGSTAIAASSTKAVAGAQQSLDSTMVAQTSTEELALLACALREMVNEFKLTA